MRSSLRSGVMSAIAMPWLSSSESLVATSTLARTRSASELENDPLSNLQETGEQGREQAVPAL